MGKLTVNFKRVRSYFRDKLDWAWQSGNVVELDRIWNRLRDQLTIARSHGKDIVSAVLVFLQEPDLLKWTKSLTEGAATVYDKAMDAFIREGIGGQEHRLFDGGHTIKGSWEAVREALPDDTRFEEITGWVDAYFKDLTTPMGMPFVTIDKADFNNWVETIVENIPGIDRRYLYDLLTFDAMEICVAGLSVVGVFFAFSKEDKENVARILGSMGISSIIAANPILGITTIALTAYSYWKHGPIDTASAVKGGGLTAISAFLFSIMALPILVELVIVVTLTVLLRKQVIDNREFASWLKQKVQDSLVGPKELINLDRLENLVSVLGTR
jgi:hypothetical protein